MRIVIPLILTSTVSLAVGEDTPTGTYILNVTKGTGVTIDERHLPSCKAKALRFFAERSNFKIVYDGKTVRVNGDEWIIKKREEDNIIIQSHTKESDYIVTIWFRRNRGTAQGTVFLEGVNSKGKSTCVDAKMLEGMYSR